MLKQKGKKSNKDILNIIVIRYYFHKSKIDFTKHCLNRLNQREILIADIQCAIGNGEVIEYHYNDYPYPSCLILGKSANNKIYILYVE